LVALSLSLGVGPARALPMGPGAEPAAVFDLASDLESDLPAKTLTNALRQLVLDGPDYALNSLGAPLVVTAADLKCKLGGPGGILPDERAFDDACLKKLGRHLGVRRFFWGFVTTRGGATVVRLHLWQAGEPDRVATLPYDEATRERVAARLYAKLVKPDQVGDLAVAGDVSGELFVGDRPGGPYAPGVELTLPAGEHVVEVRQGPRVVARARALVVVGRRAEARLEPVATPTPPPPGHVHEPPPITVRPKASAWPWVLGSVGVAGLAGSGAFYLLRSDARDDLRLACPENICPEARRSAVRRADLYGTISVASLGVGLAASAGLVTYLLMAKREPKIVGGAVPIAGGWALSLEGRF
jgi:hypothetical protein